ncbi:hypothetical protein ACIP10_30850 [Streptomyces galbus]|uniref:hypothetical protein n=1 Tax=Streptomyces galbus TaxID=33898 RepID=UPI0037FEE941
MAVSISAVLLLLTIAIALVRNAGLNPTHALACVLLGFYLAGSSLAPTIQDLTSKTAQAIAQVRP